MNSSIFKTANIIYQYTSIGMIVMLIIMLFITQNFPTFGLVQGILVGWILQYVWVNILIKMVKEKFLP